MPNHTFNTETTMITATLILAGIVLVTAWDSSEKS
jgi:hypothetical protein